jgi:predicted metal-dependent hydrolase
MRRKWASFSSKGSLTLATDLLVHPVGLVEYAICHELLHQRLPDHNKGFQAMLAAWMPDWRERERRLMVQGIEWGTTTSIGETYGET